MNFLLDHYRYLSNTSPHEGKRRGRSPGHPRPPGHRGHPGAGPAADVHGSARADGPGRRQPARPDPQAAGRGLPGGRTGPAGRALGHPVRADRTRTAGLPRIDPAAARGRRRTVRLRPGGNAANRIRGRGDRRRRALGNARGSGRPRARGTGPAAPEEGTHEDRHRGRPWRVRAEAEAGRAPARPGATTCRTWAPTRPRRSTTRCSPARWPKRWPAARPSAAS